MTCNNLWVKVNQLMQLICINRGLLDCQGVSPAKKMALLKKFGSVARIQRASVDDIAEMSGFSVKSAERILDFLKK